jgi:hypothetical protein
MSEVHTTIGKNQEVCVVFHNPGARRVSTTLRQSSQNLVSFSCVGVFHKKIRARIAWERRSPTRSTHSIPAFVLLQTHFAFSELIAAVSGSRAGLLIQTSLGRAGGLGALRTKRSG